MIRGLRGTVILVAALLSLLLFYHLMIWERYQRVLSPMGSSNEIVTLDKGTTGSKTATDSKNADTPINEMTEFKPADGSGLVPKPGTYGDAFAPEVYYMEPKENEWCESIYGLTYLRRIVDTATEYCELESTTKMTCFKALQCNGEPKDCEDHFCVARGVAVDMLALPDQPMNDGWEFPPRKESEKPFLMDCKLREWNKKSGVMPVDGFRKHMFQTGPHETFHNFVKNISFPEPEQREEAKVLCEGKKNRKEWYILFKRDGTNEKGTHPWHGGMELFSLFLTLDVMRSGPNPMYTEMDMENAQVVLLDDFPGGDFESLWRVFAKKPILRRQTLKKKLAEEGDTCLDNVVIPLPGASNPMWKGDWQPHNCTRSVLLDTFIARLLKHYRVKPSEREPDAPIRMTFLTRPERRKLHDKERLLDMAREKFPNVEIRDMNLWDMEMAEKLKAMTETDLLVGVHGSELTFAMFQPSGTSVVEIQPEKFNHYGFRNMAGLRGQRYFKAHAKIDEGVGPDWAWQKTKEVTIEDDKWMELIEAGVRSVMQRGVRSDDVV